MHPEPDIATDLLRSAADGDARAADRLAPLVYDELRALAASYLRRERADHTLQPTALVHEAYLRLIDDGQAGRHGRAHFFAIAAEAIRRVLVDHARAKESLKRGGDWRRISLSDTPAATFGRDLDLLALDEALTRLRELHERQARVVELRFFAGLTNDEVAATLGVSRSTVADDWTVARAWLLSELSESDR